VVRGGEAGDLPIEQPTKYEFVINFKTAKAIGLAVPKSYLLRADEVIGIAKAFCCTANVSFWHKADLLGASKNVRLWGKTGPKTLVPNLTALAFGTVGQAG
jgi:hypothetical protein